MKNSRRSDRELAKALGISQPTVSRTRVRLEKQGLIDYSAVPNLAKLGFEIIAVTFAKRSLQEHSEINFKKGKDFAERHPEIIFGAAGNGLGYERIAISIHRNYSDYSTFLREARNEWADIMEVQESFIIGLKSKDVIQPLSLKHLAENLKNEEES